MNNDHDLEHALILKKNLDFCTHTIVQLVKFKRILIIIDSIIRLLS